MLILWSLADLRRLYYMAGVENKPTVFLFNDTQVVMESFLEDINNILSSGEVPNLYKPDEFEEVRLKYFFDTFQILRELCALQNPCLQTFFKNSALSAWLAIAINVSNDWNLFIITAPFNLDSAVL